MTDNQTESLFAKTQAENRNEINRFTNLKPVKKQDKTKSEPMDELQKLFAARGQFQKSSSEKSSQNSNNLNDNGLKDTPN